jgi:hypothetical protein
MFGRGIKLFILFGFEVKIDASWLIIALLVTFTLAQGAFPSMVKGLSPSSYWLRGIAGAIGLFVSSRVKQFSVSSVDSVTGFIGF